MMIFLKILISVVIVAIAVLVQNLINSNRKSRAGQFWFPIVIALLGIVFALFGFRLLDEVNTWFVEDDFWFRSDILIVNVIFLVSSVVAKAVFFVANKLVERNDEIIETFSGYFYAYDTKYKEWFLLNKWTNFRKLIFFLLCAFTLLTGIFLGVTWVTSSESLIWNLALPGIALAIANEVYGYINGFTKEEYEHDILGENADARRSSNFYKVREVFEKLFPEPLLAMHTSFEFSGKESASELIKTLKNSELNVDKIAADYFSAESRYKKSETDFVQATVDILHRKNVLFFNPFYRDLSMYVTLPIINSLLSGKKCTVISGRRSNCDDIKSWLNEILSQYSHMDNLWTIDVLSEKDPECDVGILSFSQLYDHRILVNNKAFFNETDLVLMIEPSLIVNTSQIALSIITQEMHCNGKKPVYCICDRNTDGLVDTLSHLLHSEITNVVAPSIPKCTYTGMLWNADGDFIRQQLFDKQTQYLGNGIEIAAVAVKNQIPTVSWYSETKSPIKDIKWIAGQQYLTLCRYMNIPPQQKSVYERIDFVSGLWSTQKKEEQFIIVEDEFCNMFSMLRDYLSRGISQSYVNVLSENYLLRDYMRCNKQVFLSNPNAVPSFVPDYAKTERNTLIKLLLLMSYRQVKEEEIIAELNLSGIETTDVLSSLSSLLKKYTFSDCSIFTINSAKNDSEEFANDSCCLFSISEEVFNEHFSKSLKNAFYIIEDEISEKDYIDAKLFGHVTQTLLPGQFSVYDGKNYIAKFVSPQSGVVLRRASDQYDERKYYRQIREYIFDKQNANSIISLKTVMDIEIAFIRRDFTVLTSGYLEMKTNHDLRTAKTIDFSNDPSVDNYTRKYHNKTVLRIKLPDTSEKIRFTISLLLSEIFKTIFPDGWQYISAVTKHPENIDGILNNVVYSASGDIDENYIYIIEDSEIDLGLLEAFDKNMMQIMEIMADFLEWHFEKMREPEREDPIPPSINYKEEQVKKERQGLFARMAKRISKLFTPKPEKNEEKSSGNEDVITSDSFEETEVKEVEIDFNLEVSKDDKSESMTIETGTGVADVSLEKSDETDKNDDHTFYDDKTAKISKLRFTEEDYNSGESDYSELVHTDGTDIFDNEGIQENDDYFEDEFNRLGILPLTKTRYQRECFLKFGFDEIDARLQIEEVRKYLRVRGWTNNYLLQARNRNSEALQDLQLQSVNRCDFCGLPLNGVSFDVLNDGRTRCNDCSRTAISTVVDFKDLFYQTLEMMESFYGIEYHVPVRVEMADARKVASGVGRIFIPSVEVTNRILGYAQRKHGKYSLIIENGSPRLATIDTMVHEMTHIWQYLNWKDERVSAVYGMGKPSCSSIAKDIVYEGMAMWASIQFLYQIGESLFAVRQEALAEQRKDVYGLGFLLFREQYPFVKDSSPINYSPFQSFPPLEPEKVKSVVKSFCTDTSCSC